MQMKVFSIQIFQPNCAEGLHFSIFNSINEVNKMSQTFAISVLMIDVSVYLPLPYIPDCLPYKVTINCGYILILAFLHRVFGIF